MASLTIPNLNIPYTGHAYAPIVSWAETDAICHNIAPCAVYGFEGFWVEDISLYFRDAALPDSCPAKKLEDAPYRIKDVVVNSDFTQLINQDSLMKVKITDLLEQIRHSFPGMSLSTTEMMNFVSFPYFLYAENETVDTFFTHLTKIQEHLDWLNYHVEALPGDFDWVMQFYDSYSAAIERVNSVIESHHPILILAQLNLPFVPPQTKLLSHILHITLDDNRLRDLPKEILGFKDLKGIYMRRNLLTKIPSQLLSFPSFVFADFQGNPIKKENKVPKGLLNVLGEHKYFKSSIPERESPKVHKKQNRYFSSSTSQ